MDVPLLMERSERRAVAVVAMASVILALWGLSWYHGGASRARREAMAKWESHEPTAYSFEYSLCSGFCPSCPIRVTVVDGEVMHVVDLNPECSTPRRSAPTIEGVFRVEQALRTGTATDSFDIYYDSRWGFPASGDFRCPEGWSDCGSGFSVTDFEVLRP